MADKTEEIEDLDQETIDCLDKYMSITPPTPIIKPSPWDEKRLISLREINAPDVLYSTDGITIENDGKPTIIPRDQIQPPAYGNARQVRVSTSLNYPLAESYRESIGTEGFKYQCPLPVVEKLEKPIKKLDGEGYYYYRLVDGRHRYHATLEYLDFPCYLVSGHEADIELLAQKLNNPKTWESGWSNDDASVMSTIKKQMEYHKETDGEKGVKSDVDSIMDYVKEHFPSTAKTDRRKFAERCLSSAGIQQDIENKDNAQWATVLKENFN